jgi:hypothetical protein
MSTRLRWDWEHSEVTKLAHDVAHAGDGAEKDCRNIVRESGEFLELLWKANATVSAGKHGKLYPLTIESHAVGMSAVIRPNTAMDQGGMAFEYGGPSVITNPNPSGRGGAYGQRVGQNAPHLDMNRAADIAFPAFHKQMADVAVIRL